jgi:hypothetical protein
MKSKIVLNSIQCKVCGEILISEHRHDFVKCSCKDFVACDGGKEYLKRTGVNYIELSKWEVDAEFMQNYFLAIRLLTKAEASLNWLEDTHIPSLGLYTYDVVSEISKFLKQIKNELV